MSDAPVTIPEKDYLGIRGTCECGYSIHAYLCNEAVMTLYPAMKAFDYMVKCSNPECTHSLGQGYCQELPEWATEAPDPANTHLTEHIMALARAALKDHREVVLPTLAAWGHSGGPMDTFREWHTVSLRFRRRAGHTTAALRLLHLIKDSVLIIPDVGAAYQRALRDAVTPEDRKRILYTQSGHPDNLLRQASTFSGTPLIIIDNASCMQNTYNYDGIADAFMRSAPSALYLLLG